MPQFNDGVSMLYPNKAGGESYVLPSNIFGRRGRGQRYDSGRVIVMGDGGEFEEVIPGVVRLTQNNNVQLCFTTSKGYGTSFIHTDRDELLDSRFMQDVRDWHNVEVTVVFRYIGGNDTGDIVLGSRTGLGDTDPCAGHEYKAGLNLDGLGGFLSKQQYFSAGNDYRNFDTTKMGTQIKGKFVALKFVIYDLDHDGKPTITSEDAESVQLEFYGSVGGSNPFRKLQEYRDQGNWGQAAVCGGEAGAIGLWGGPITTLEWRNGAVIEIQSVSVREIDPTTDFDAVMSGGGSIVFPPNPTPTPTPVPIPDPDPTPTKVTYSFDYKFGKNGSGNGEFLNPHDISFDSSGNAFVSDRNRNDVQKFTHEGVYISKFGGPGSGNAQFNVPYAIQHSPTGDIYVVDRGNNRVQRLDSAGAYISQITTVNGTALNAPEDICFTPSGDMYICDTGNNRIVKLSNTHTFILQWGTTGSGDGQFDHVHSIDVDDAGNVYANSGNQPYIQKFSSTGAFIKKWGKAGTKDGQLLTFLEHMDIQGGRLHIVNNNKRPIVSVFDLEGNFLTKYGSPEKEGSANGQFKEPEHVTVYTDGKPFVIDSSNFRVQVFKMNVGTVSTQSVTVTAATATGTEAVGQVNDSLGVQQIYKTKPGGSVWVSTPGGLLSDPQFSDNNYTIKKGSNGVYNVPGSSRIQSFSTKAQAKKGPDFDGYATHDYDELKKRGAWDSTTTDWRDVEMTAYVKLKGSNTGSSGDEISWVIRSVRHNNASNNGCGGSSYHGNLHISGFCRFKKEDWHVSYQNDSLLSKGIGSVNGKTVGFKFVLYNIDDTKVYLEVWVDKDNNNKWQQMGSKIDAGDWTTNGPDMKHCGATSNTAIISWGSPKVIWKWNAPLSVDISKMSVREIIPTKEDATPPVTPPPTTGGGSGGGDVPATGGTGQVSRLETTYTGMYDVIVDSTGQTCAGAAPPSGTGTYTEKTDFTVTTITDDKQLAASWSAENDRDRVGWYCGTGDAKIHGIRPTRVGVYLKKVGSPTGNATVTMRDSSNNIKVTYGTIDVSTLTTSYVFHSTEFTNDNAATLMGQGMATDWKISVEYNDASSNSSNHICVGVNYNNPVDGVKTYEFQHEKEPGPGYSTVKHTTRDMCGKLYTSP
jgi:hypothetical protein